MNIKITVLKLLFFTFFCFKSYSRQSLPAIDTTVLRNWHSLIDGSGIISNNGLYAGYSESNSIYTYFSPAIFTFKSLNSSWEVRLDSIAGPAFITKDSKLGVVKLKGDRLCIVELGKDIKEYISQVDFFKLLNVNNKQLLIYSKTGTERDLIIRNLSTNIEARYPHTSNYVFSDDGNWCYFTTKDNQRFRIDLLNTSTENQINIWEGEKQPTALLIDKTGNQLCFTIDSLIYYWDRNTGGKPHNLTFAMEGDCKNLTINKPTKFSPGGKFIFVSMQGPPLPPLNPNVNPVQVFSYQDGWFDIHKQREEVSYLGAYDVSSGKLIRLEYENESFRCLSSDEQVAVVSKKDGDGSEYYWNLKGLSRDYIVSLNNNKRILIERKIGNFELSPLGKSVIYQEDWGGDFYSKNVQTGIIINLTKDLPIPLKDDVVEMPMTNKSRGLEFYNWSEGEESVIVYDRYDIWMLDVNGRKLPVNLTNGYGRKHHIVFRFCQLNKEDKLQKFNGQEIVISAFNEDTKDNGFYNLKVKSGKDPLLLTMGKEVFLTPGQMVRSSVPKKAANTNTWLVWRMSARESPNYYWTNDFKNFKEVSNIHPERGYQWHTTELINFTTKDGVKTQAVIFKPDNFDSTKRYPVLFNYYEHETAKLNAFLVPNITDKYCFNYPLMLARGYLICLTDIHFKEGETAHSIVDAVEGAGEFLSRLPYVDSSHYGACGGSMAGYITNCLATFSHKFAAAVTISGPSDLISAYGNDPGLRDEEYENRQFRMGVSLSTDPVRYLRNSPVAYTKGMNTPIMIVNNKIDWNVNVQQGIEFFISLRREGKRAWLLRYQHEGHGIFDWGDQHDLCTRMNQFFDHYLKGAPVPVWMSRGISPNETGVKSGFEYDKEIKTPLPSALLIPSK